MPLKYMIESYAQTLFEIVRPHLVSQRYVREILSQKITSSYTYSEDQQFITEIWNSAYDEENSSCPHLAWVTLNATHGGTNILTDFVMNSFIIDQWPRKLPWQLEYVLFWEGLRFASCALHIVSRSIDHKLTHCLTILIHKLILFLLRHLIII